MPDHRDGYQPSGERIPIGSPPTGGSSGKRPNGSPPAGPGMQAQRHIIEFSPAVERALERIADALEGLNLSGVIMSQETETLIAEMERNTSVVGSALTFIAGIQAQLADAGTDPEKLAKLAADLKANDDKLAAAIVTNTPATPAPAPEAAPVVDPAPVDPSAAAA